MTFVFPFLITLWLSLTFRPAATALHRKAALPTATTRNGSYYGVHVPQLSQDIFRGIPFAHAPRFQIPQSLNETWEGSRPATEPGLTCVGFGTNAQYGWPVGEDCLNLNVVRPEGISCGASLPVLVWIYGGGFRQGSNRDPEFNTSFLLQTAIEIGHPIIIVSINYRLSGFGFLSSYEVQAEGITNLGIRDQWKSLEWIHENIEGFGGDPDRVTIWGESAGGYSVNYLNMGYGGKNSGLFKRSIMSSGSAFGVPLSSQTDNQPVYNAIAAGAGCSYAQQGSLQCLREVSLEILNSSIATFNPQFYFCPIADGDIIRNSPRFAFEHGLIAPVDIITGSTSDEGMSSAFSGQTSLNTSDQVSALMQYVAGIPASLAAEWLSFYPPNASYPPYSESMTLDWPALTATVGVQSGAQTRRVYGIVTDFAMTAGRRLTSASWNKINPGKKAYSYRWDVDPSRSPVVPSPRGGIGFAQHGFDLPFQFRLPYAIAMPGTPIPNVTAMQRVSYAMQVHWASFAATGNPNSHGLKWIPSWPAYGDDAQNGAKNFVYNATLDNVLNLHVEDDNFRAPAIDWLNSWWKLLNRG